MNQNEPSPEAIRAIQAFLLARGTLRTVRVAIAIDDPGVTDEQVTTHIMYMSSNQISNLREAMTGMAQETKKRKDNG